MAYSARTPTTNLLTQIVSSVAHGFTVGEVVNYNGAWGLAQADTLANANQVGMISFVPDADTFYVTQAGHISALPFAVVDGSVYYLSPTVAGELTTVKPGASGQVVIQLFIADSASSGYFFSNAGEEVSADGLLPWTVVGVNAQLVVNNGYFSSSGVTLNFALPAASSVGDTIHLSNVAGQWNITQAAAQQIVSSGASSTIGVAGTVTSNAAGDSITFVCSTANFVWHVTSMSGTITFA